MELELAVDVLAAIVNDRNLVYPCNVPNCGALSTFADDRVVEVPCLVNRHGATPLVQGPLPRAVAGLVEMLGEYQALAAATAWSGTRADGIRALLCNPLVHDPAKATAIYDELAGAHRATCRIDYFISDTNNRHTLNAADSKDTSRNATVGKGGI